MSTSLSELIYCSVATGPVGASFDPTLTAILSVARRNNERHGITGALISNSGYFAQLIEGPSEAVEKLFETVRGDPRHRDAVLVSRRPISARSFPDWAMGFTAAADNAATAAILARAVASGDEALAADIRSLLERSMERAKVWGTPVPEGETAQS